jgi:hypothetical protein
VLILGNVEGVDITADLLSGTSQVESGGHRRGEFVNFRDRDIELSMLVYNL